MKRWEGLRLLAITDAERHGPENVLRKAEELLAECASGSVAIQLRDHKLSARLRLEFGHRLRQLTAAFGQALIVNDRLDLAVLLRADGIHLGEGSVAQEDARRALHLANAPVLASAGIRMGEEPFWWSRSAHSLDALGEGPSAWLLSPILEPRKGRVALGANALTVARARLERCAYRSGVRPRLFALGGVGAGMAAHCISAGADGVAAMGAVWGEDPRTLIDELGIGRSA